MPASVQTTILAGSLAGFSSTLLVHPLDVVRTKIQSSVVSCENPPTTFQVGERQRKRIHFYRYSLLQLAHSQNAAALAVSWLRGVASFQGDAENGTLPPASFEDVLQVSSSPAFLPSKPENKPDILLQGPFAASGCTGRLQVCHFHASKRNGEGWLFLSLERVRSGRYQRSPLCDSRRVCEVGAIVRFLFVFFLNCGRYFKFLWLAVDEGGPSHLVLIVVLFCFVLFCVVLCCVVCCLWKNCGLRPLTKPALRLCNHVFAFLPLAASFHFARSSKSRNNIIVNSMPLSSFKSISSAYRGAHWSVCRDFVGCGAFFGTLRVSKASMPELPSYAHGAFAGVSFWLFALPLDSIKTLVQTEKEKQLVYDKIMKRPSLLLRGWQVAVCRGIPGAACTVYVYELCCSLLENTS